MKEIITIFTNPAGIQFILITVTAILAIAFAIWLLSFRNPVHAALCLIGNFVCLAVIYIMLGSFLMGVVQLVVYAGAIMVLFLFVIMFFFTPSLESKYESNPMKNTVIWGISLGLVLFLLISYFFWLAPNKAGSSVTDSKIRYRPQFNLNEGLHRNRAASSENSPVVIEAKGGPLVVTAFELLNKNIVAFELVSLLLLAAIIGSVVLVKQLSTNPSSVINSSEKENTNL